MHINAVVYSDLTIYDFCGVFSSIRRRYRQADWAVLLWDTHHQRCCYCGFCCCSALPWWQRRRKSRSTWHLSVTSPARSVLVVTSVRAEVASSSVKEVQCWFCLLRSTAVSMELGCALLVTGPHTVTSDRDNMPTATTDITQLGDRHAVVLTPPTPLTTF